MKRIVATKSTTLYRYTFADGTSYTTKLPQDEFLKRLCHLDTLRVLTEGYEEGTGVQVYHKALGAYNKLNNFTGIIRLTSAEKDWLSYMLENDMLDETDIECIKYYCKQYV